MRPMSRATAGRVRERDAAAERAARLTRWAAGGGLVAVGVASAVAAATLPGHSPTAGSGSPAVSNSTQPGGAGSGSSGSLGGGAVAPQQAPPAAPPVAVSGGS